jgi:hypothetical protein
MNPEMVMARLPPAFYGIFASLAFGLLGLWFTRGEARVHGDDR